MPTPDAGPRQPAQAPGTPEPQGEDRGKSARAPRPHAPEQDEPPRPHGDPNAPLVPGHDPAA
ncbi:MAG TPA: hypothetical protein VGD77_01405 [Gemmatimonadaceae bacterium]